MKIESECGAGREIPSSTDRGAQLVRDLFYKKVWHSRLELCLKQSQRPHATLHRHPGSLSTEARVGLNGFQPVEVGHSRTQLASHGRDLLLSLPFEGFIVPGLWESVKQSRVLLPRTRERLIDRGLIGE